MRSLHFYDSPEHGGATIAAQSVVDCAGLGLTYALRPPPPTTWQRAVRTIGGYCDPWAVRWFRWQLRQTACDVVHLHNFKELGTAAIAAAKREGKPVVWSCYDYWCLSARDIETTFNWRTYRPAKNPRWWHWWARSALLGRTRRIRHWLNKLDAIICLSKHSADLLDEHGFTAPKFVISLPVTVPAFDVQRDPHFVLFVGGFAPHKGKAVFDAAKRIVEAQRPEVHCWAIFCPRRHEILRWIAQAACLVVPEQWPTPGPVVIAEAQLLGTPVVASNIGGIPEMSVPLARCDSPEEFAHLIRCTLYGESPFGQLCPPHEIGQRIAQCRHDPAKIRKQLEEVYKRCAKRTP